MTGRDSFWMRAKMPKASLAVSHPSQPAGRPSGQPPELTGREALTYIQDLSQSLSDMAAKMDHSYLATLLADASAEAGRLALREEF